MSVTVSFYNMASAIQAIAKVDILHHEIALLCGQATMSVEDDYFMAPWCILCMTKSKKRQPLSKWHTFVFTGIKSRAAHDYAHEVMQHVSTEWRFGLMTGDLGFEEDIVGDTRFFYAKDKKNIPYVGTGPLRECHWKGVDEALYERAIQRCAEALGVPVPPDWQAQRKAYVAAYKAAKANAPPMAQTYEQFHGECMAQARAIVEEMAIKRVKVDDGQSMI
jgi:hypothetical protein